MKDSSTHLLSASAASAEGGFAERVVSAVRNAVGSQRTSVSLHEPWFRGNEWAYVKDCIDTGWVSSVGSYVNRFEELLTQYTGAKYAVATANGTAALHICLLLAGVKPGEEVLVPALTFVATANAVLYAGGVPHFVDSEEASFAADPVALDEYLNTIARVENGICVNQRTGAAIRAFVPMHVFGMPGQVAAWMELCAKWHLQLVEDAAESLGSFYEGRHTGTFGLVGALSFNGNKVVTTGGGGAILTNDAALAKRAKHLTTTARVAHRWSFLHDEVGFNYRMPNLNAALGVAQLEQLPEFIELKRSLQQRYRTAFQNIEGLVVVSEQARTRSNYWLVALLLEKEDEAMRDLLLEELNAAGLMSRPVWTLMHQLPMYMRCPRMDLQVAQSLSARIVNVPSSPVLAT